MSYVAGALATLQLAEFLAIVSGYPDQTSATQAAVERAAQALESEVCVALWPDSVTAVGFPADRLPIDDLRCAVSTRPEVIHVPGAGPCHLVIAPLDAGPPGHLLLARAAEAFTEDEIYLVRAMARVLSLTLRMLRTIEAERTLREQGEHQAVENNRLLHSLQDRQRLMEALSAIERAIARHDPVQTILDTITAQARHLIGDETAILRMFDPDNPDDLLLVSADGLSEQLSRRMWRIPLAEAPVSNRAITTGEVVAAEGPAADPPSQWELPDDLHATMAAPVHENGTVVGSLLVASSRTERRYSEADRQTLGAFADHISLAVTDAKTVEAMHEAFHDPLTGLASRALFLDRIEHQLASMGRDNTPVGLLFIDLDRFKIVNDTLGHGAGDQLLVQVAERLVRCLRARDTAARFGGDEFAALLWDADTHEATRIADRIIESIRKPYDVEGRQVFVNASIGIAIGVPGRQKAVELLRDADVAMYRAKRNGKGRSEAFEPQMHQELVDRMQMEGDLRRAVGGAEFVLHYQPIISLTSGRISGFEALVRWRRPGYGLVSPTEFAPLAEETGLILPIGQWVLREACRQARRWHTEFGQLSPVVMNVNLSARQLQHPNLTAELREILAETGIPPDSLVLEITETFLHHDVDAAIGTLRALKDLDVRLAVDDFGTGYSSLSSLHLFPVDIVKIDRSFVDASKDGPRAAAFVSAMVQLGQTLQLETIAEGIETTDHLVLLRRAQCQLGQGEFFSKPLTGEQATLLLRTAAARDPGTTLPNPRGLVDSLGSRPTPVTP